MTDTYDREPTEHERAGMAWWNSLTKEERTLWLYMAGHKSSPADAYEAHLKNLKKQEEWRTEAARSAVRQSRQRDA